MINLLYYIPCGPKPVRGGGSLKHINLLNSCDRN